MEPAWGRLGLLRRRHAAGIEGISAEGGFVAIVVAVAVCVRVAGRVNDHADAVVRARFDIELGIVVSDVDRARPADDEVGDVAVAFP